MQYPLWSSTESALQVHAHAIQTASGKAGKGPALALHTENEEMHYTLWSPTAPGIHWSTEINPCECEETLWREDNAALRRDFYAALPPPTLHPFMAVFTGPSAIDTRSYDGYDEAFCYSTASGW